MMSFRITDKHKMMLEGLACDHYNSTIKHAIQESVEKNYNDIFGHDMYNNLEYHKSLYEKNTQERNIYSKRNGMEILNKKKEEILQRIACGAVKNSLGKEYGVSLPTFYKWLKINK